MSATPFMPLWVADFVGDTLDLDAKEIGAYMLILMTMWGRDGYLPNDTKKLQRVARCGRDWPRVWSAIEHYFTVEGDQITQLRLLKERKNVASKRAVNAQSGALGGRAKALKYSKQTLANATGALKQPEPEPERVKEQDKSCSKKPRRKPLVDIPEGWVPSDRNIQDALDRGLSQTEIDHEADSFRNHHHSKQSRYRDWDAAWRTWCGNAVKFRASRRMAVGQIPGGRGQGSSIASIVARRHAAGEV
jgi:uncharacterized protein YdaU (DUF1376 family)